MNTLMIQNGYKGCGYVRLSLPAYHNGFDVVDTKNETREKLPYADVVVFHRPESEEYLNLAIQLKKQGKKIVMDNDDTFNFKGDETHPLANLSPEAEDMALKIRQDAIIDFLKIADLVTTTTKTLASEYRENNDNVLVLPNCVDPFDWDEPLRNDGKKARIGLVGSASMEYDYKHIKDVLRKLDKRDDVQLFMFGLGDKKHRKENPKVVKLFKEDYAFWDSLDIEHTPWCDISDYPTKLNEARLDMMLIPRRDNYFNRCKSNIKFLEASMCEIPVIAQSYENSPYEEIEDMKNGILIKDNEDWEKMINWLIDDKKRRRLMGKTAKQYVLNNYNIEDKAQLWEDAYLKLYETSS